MFTDNDWKSHFNPLYLQEAEVKTQEKWSKATFSDPENGRSFETEPGLLHICSKSLIFEPLTHSKPLVKFLMRNFTQDVKGTLGPDGSHDIEFSVEAYTEINALSSIPVEHRHNFVKKPVFVRISFEQNDSEKSLIQALCELNRSAPTTGADQILEVSKLMLANKSQFKFKLSKLESINEQTQFKQQIIVTEVSPLALNYGLLHVTNQNLYIQSVTTREESIQRIKIRSISKMFKRRYNLADLGLEVFLVSELSAKASFFLAFDSTEWRDKVFDIIRSFNPDSITDENLSLDDLTHKWKTRIISNYDYLKQLNERAHRSYNDLSQYPVFPWVVSDFESEELDLENPKVFRDLTKPIGAVNQERLERFRERLTTMGGPKYLYGTHYSSPFYVVSYLVRKYPLFMLHLNNGKYEKADRIFTSVADDWRVSSESTQLCYTSFSVVKELIPEFYEEDDSFLINKLNVNFGHKQNGELVGDVELPPWAKKDPQIFLAKMREALESDYVSDHLNHWIDLIFGYKQKGEEADRAMNVFDPISYEGEVDISKIADPVKRRGTIVQIQEFGQAPRQLFTTPHPRREPKTHQSHLYQDRSNMGEQDKQALESLLYGSTFDMSKSKFGSKLTQDAPASSSTRKSTLTNSNISAVARKSTVVCSSAKVTDACFVDDTNSILCLTDDGFLRKVDLDTYEVDSTKIASIPLSGIVPIGHSHYLIALSTGELTTYSLESSSVQQSWEAHSDPIIMMKAFPQKDLAVTISKDGTLKIWASSFGNVEESPYHQINDLQADPLCICVADSDEHLGIGDEQGFAYVYSMDSFDQTFSVKSVGSAINQIAVDIYSNVIVVFGHQVTIFNKDNKPIQQFKLDAADLGPIIYLRPMENLILLATKTQNFVTLDAETGKTISIQKPKGWPLASGLCFLRPEPKSIKNIGGGANGTLFTFDIL